MNRIAQDDERSAFEAGFSPDALAIATLHFVEDKITIASGVTGEFKKFFIPRNLRHRFVYFNIFSGQLTSELKGRINFFLNRSTVGSLPFHSSTVVNGYSFAYNFDLNTGVSRNVVPVRNTAAASTLFGQPFELVVEADEIQWELLSNKTAGFECNCACLSMKPLA